MNQTIRKKMRRRRLWKRRWVDALYFVIGVPLIVLLIRLLARSLRVQFVDPEHYRKIIETGRPIIWVFWHEDLFGILTAFMRTRPGRPAVMISRSRDGEKLARVIAPLGLVPIRGSSSRGAVRGLIELKKWLTQSDETLPMAALALDGPRGPRRQAKPGAVMLGRQSGALLVPVAFHSSRRWVFGSWDRTRLPKPFASLRIHLGEPRDPSDSDQTENEIAGNLQLELDKLITEEPAG